MGLEIAGLAALLPGGTMLSYLRICNLALIDDLTLEPGAGLMAMTGETGAGKSIVLDGLALLAGQRGSLDQVRAGAAAASVEGVFDLRARPDVVALLRHDGFDAGDDGLVVRRTLGADAGRAHVDDRVVTVRTLRMLGEALVDIVSQHESQALLTGAAHAELLDRFGGLAELRDEVAARFDRARELLLRQRELAAGERERSQRADYLRFQIDEIRTARLSEDEEAELAAERQRLRHADELAQAATEALDAAWESERSAVALLARAQARLATIERLDPGSGLSASTLQEARYAIEETARQLQGYADDVRADPRRLQQVEERLAAIDALRRKYGDSVADVLACAARAEAELDGLQNRDQEIAAIGVEVAAAARDFDASATALSQRRREAARRLEKVIEAELTQLAMTGARFVVELTAESGDGDGLLPPGASRRGYERAEFQLAANPGEEPRPLARVASGGELSRVMLALRLAELESAPPRTLVFDEIDAGIGGGRVADRLAERLAALGKRHQVLVVTHLPQIAARADRHVLVSKVDRDGRTQVNVATLQGEARVDELARMLGGIDISDSLRAHARSLLGTG